MVRLGELDLNPTVDDGASPLDVSIELVLPHEEYNSQRLVNDIAVLKLRDRVTFGSKFPCYRGAGHGPRRAVTDEWSVVFFF